MKKRIVILLTIVFAFSFVSSCAAESSELISFMGGADDSFTADLKGRDVIIGVAQIDKDSIVPIPEDTSTKADTQRRIIKDVEIKLNCNVTQEEVDYDHIAASIMADNCKFDLMYSHTATHFDLIKAGLFYDISKMEGIDLSNEAKWGSAQDQTHRMYKGQVFGVKPQNAGSSYGSLEGVILANDALIQRFGQPTPKELLEQGKWTFDTFVDYLTAVSDMSSDEPIYGMSVYTGQLHQIPITAIFANGSQLLNVSDSGEYSFDLLSDPKAIKALEWSKDVYDTGVVVEDDFDDTPAGYFTNGRSSMFLGGAWIGTTNRDGYPLNSLESGYSFICVPYGPDGVYGETYSSFIFVSNSISVPITSDEFEMACFLNEFCVEPTEEEMIELQEETKNYYFFHPEDYDYVMDMASNAAYTYLYAELDEVRSDLMTALENITQGKNAISESIGSVQAKVENALLNIQ